MKNEFSTFDIMKALDLKRERLREWMNKGFVSPSIEKAAGQGTKALFSREDIYRIALFKRFVEDLGMKREHAVQYVGRAFQFESDLIRREQGKQGRIVHFLDPDNEVPHFPHLVDWDFMAVTISQAGVETLGFNLEKENTFSLLESRVRSQKRTIDTIVIINIRQLKQQVNAALDAV